MTVGWAGTDARKLNRMEERYDTIGIGYDSTRRADPYLARKMFDFLNSGQPDANYLDIGCGTGNYTHALNEMGLSFIGIEPSEEMLSKARAKNNAITWQQGTAENICLESEIVEGVLVSLTIHHWTSLVQGFSEVFRVLKKQGKVVLFTTLPEQTQAYWLSHYFPTMIEDSVSVLPPLQQIEQAFQKAGLTIIQKEPYFVQPDLEDWFLYCGKHRPEMYFQEEVRNGISSFSLIAKQEEIKTGLERMRSDLHSGKLDQVIKEHENDLGDYLFIVGEKQK